MKSRRDHRMHGGNRFKLGLFGLNCSGGLTMTKAPERWDASWENNLRATRLAEQAGLEFVLPVARWHGYRGETDAIGTSLETITWASGLLAATNDIAAFGTVHVPLINPIFAAKQCVTADQIGSGRFGLNIVSGWNAGEFEMFGVNLLEHDERYVYSEEWTTIVKKVWSEPEPFDFEGKYFNLKGVLIKPKPYGEGRPLLMSAGSSKAGRAFAARHADCLFMVIVDRETLPKDIRTLREEAGREVGVYASGHIISKRTAKETQEYYRYIIHEMGDWAAADHMADIRRGGQSIPHDRLQQMKERMVSGTGTFPIVGDPDEVASIFKFMSDAGMNGMAVGLVNYVDDFPYFQAEILPRLERLGLRVSPP
jgi:alkanesulfonate monooxygenase SsuD/methylene tetrahydromethanopterin reductase-like flavin-dependent oxidoreductase (luciferase family)